MDKTLAHRTPIDYCGFEADKIAGNPALQLAWDLCQIIDDDAPMRWRRHVTTAQCLLVGYAMERKGWEASANPPITDQERFNWLDRQVLKSRTGVSFDRVPAVDGDPSGIRFMRQGHIGEPCKDVRAAIDRHIRMGRDNT